MSGDIESHVTTLPAELEERLREVLRATRLPAGELARLAEELREHLRDGLDAGYTVSELRASFGEPANVAGLLRDGVRATESPWRRAQRLIQRSAMAIAALLALLYIASAARLFASGALVSPGQLTGRVDTTLVERLGHIDFQIARARDFGMRAESSEATHALRHALSEARSLYATGDLPARIAGLVLMERTLVAGDSLSVGAALDRELARLQSGVPIRWERATVIPELELLLDRLYLEGGGLAPSSLVLLGNLKGVREPAVSARLLAPIYFATAAWSEPAARAMQRVLARDTGALEPRDVILATIRERLLAAERAAVVLERRRSAVAPGV